MRICIASVEESRPPLLTIILESVSLARGRRVRGDSPLAGIPLPVARRRLTAVHSPSSMSPVTPSHALTSDVIPSHGLGSPPVAFGLAAGVIPLASFPSAAGVTPAHFGRPRSVTLNGKSNPALCGWSCSLALNGKSDPARFGWYVYIFHDHVFTSNCLAAWGWMRSRSHGGRAHSRSILGEPCHDRRPALHWSHGWYWSSRW